MVFELLLTVSPRWRGAMLATCQRREDYLLRKEWIEKKSKEKTRGKE
jgi:hypothetical protein